ncbi:hypothetical protein MY11210_003829 [Beauveria gryllotalpidicola]
MAAWIAEYPELDKQIPPKRAALGKRKETTDKQAQSHARGTPGAGQGEGVETQISARSYFAEPPGSVYHNQQLP